ncbi:MAG: hypothetical protein AB7S77_02715 [Desulfatirhabdiaceae bacterium]
MTHDPFDNLSDWGPVLQQLHELADSGKLAECQAGLIRILRYKGNWRLREEVLKRIGEISNPSNPLLDQVLAIVGDDNIYYEARILAGDTLIQLLKNRKGSLDMDLPVKIRQRVEKLKNMPQPPFFESALNRLHSQIASPEMV